MVEKDRFSFEEACKELQISEEELEQLVANGEIASVKEGDTLFFKKEIISNFKKSRKTEPTIILADEDMEVLEGMEEIDLGVPEEEAVQQPERPLQPTASKKDVVKEDFPAEQEIPELSDLEEVVVETRSSGEDETGEPAEPVEVGAELGTPDDTVLNLDGLLEDDGSEGTTPIPGIESLEGIDEGSDITVEGNISDDTLLDTDLLEIGEEEDSFKLDSATEETLVDPTEATLLRGGGARAMQMKRKKSHAAWTISMVVTSLVLLVPLGVSLNTFFVTRFGENKMTEVASGGEPVYKWIFDSNVLAGVVKGIADLFAGS